MKKIIFINLLLYSLVIIAQTASSYIPKIENTPTSPEVALLGRFGDIPIGYYTGTADVSVPIYTIKEDDFELPITMQYHTSGIKVDDQATWVGLGWNLVPEGVITQEVRGIRDKFDHMNFTSTTGFKKVYDRMANSGGFGNFKVIPQDGDMEPYMWMPNIGGDFGKCTPIYTSDNSMDHPHTLFDFYFDKGQPDIYHFSFAGHSGKFYINPNTNEIVQINQKENITFEVNPESSIIAKLPNGIEFTFNAIEEIYFLGTDKYDERSGRTYKLTDIRLKNGHHINFNYLSAKYTNNSISEYDPLYSIEDIGSYYIGGKTIVLKSGPNQQREQFVYNQYNSEVKILKSIVTQKEIISFNLEEREDIVNLANSENLKKLKSIDILVNNQDSTKIKTYELGYSYFPYTTVGIHEGQTISDSYGKRLKLDYIQEYTYDEEKVKTKVRLPYQFEYNMDKTMPLRNSFSKDMWGYYNGSTGNNSLIPDLLYYAFPEQYSVFTINNSRFKYPAHINNRYSDLSFAKTYSLNKIIYPTRGYTKFEYELNSFTNQFIPNKELNEKSRKNINVYNNGYLNNQSLITSKNFKPNKTVTLEIDREAFDGFTPYNNTNAPVYSYAQMSNIRVELIKSTLGANGTPSTSIIATMGLNVSTPEFTQNHGAKWHDEIKLEYDPNATYEIRVVDPTGFYLSNDTYHIAGLKVSALYYDNLDVDTSHGYGGGLRISSVKNYNYDGTPISEKRISYTDGKLLNRFNPIQNKKYYNFACYDKVEVISPISRNLLSINSDEVVKQSGVNVGYSKVIVNDIDVNDTNKKSFNMEYNYNNNENLSSAFFPVIENSTNGLLISEIISEDNNKKKEKIFSYENLKNIDNVYYSIKMVKNFYTNGISPSLGRATSLDSPTIYSYYGTPLISDYYKLTSIATNEYFNNEKLTTSVNYNYDYGKKLSSIEIVYPDKTKEITEFKYAGDLALSGLIQANMTEIPMVIEKKKVINNISKTISLTEIKYDGPTFMPTRVLTSLLDDKNKQSTEVTYKYDLESSNVIQINKKNGLSEVILWGYNKQYPIAKIIGATYPDPTNPKPTDIPQSLINSLDIDSYRNDPSSKNFQIFSYTYKPLIGVTSITPPNGLREIYKYDSANRLQSVVDVNGKILKEFKYNYITKLYFNIEKSQTFVKNNCNDGFQGNNYVYTVPAGSYSSSLSQADADNLAQNDINSNGQTAANNFGTCSAAPIVTCTFTKNPTLSLSNFSPLFSNSSSQGNLGKLDITFNSSSSYAWTYQTLIGNITSNCIPTIERNISYTENGRTWSVDIKTNGEVYLKFVSGSNFYSNTTVTFNIQYLK